MGWWRGRKGGIREKRKERKEKENRKGNRKEKGEKTVEGKGRKKEKHVYVLFEFRLITVSECIKISVNHKF